MNIRKRYSKDLEQNYRKLNLNRNEFTPIENKIIGHDVIKEFLKQKDVAPWFRGTSHFHIQGADRLFNALRDDGEQKTTHRVRACLSLIGLKPLITPKQIMFLMRLSRGNDLVFLWFLLEMHYKTPKRDSNSYSVNEQLICSAICHLDMIPTLRELDKILPNSHTSRIQMKKSSRKREKLKELFIKRNSGGIHNKFVLPYFEKFRRPEQYGKRLFVEKPNFKVNFNFYARYNNPNHTAQNEANRWYAGYQFNPGLRVVLLIIQETITNMFHNFEAVSLRSRTVDVLCDYHKNVKMMAANLELELKVKDRNECLEYYFKSKENKGINNNKTTNFLENAVQKQLQKSYEQSKIIRENATVKTITSDCKILDVILGGSKLCNNNTNRIDDPVAAASNVYVKKQEPWAFHGDILDSTFHTENTNSYKNMQNGNLKGNYPKDLGPHKNKFKEINKMKNDDYCNVSDIATPPPDAVFTCPTMNKPFQFNYRKIFVPKAKDNEERCIRKMFLAALDENMSSMSTDINEAGNLYDEAVIKCAKKTFDNEVKKYEAEKTDDIEAQKAESVKPISQNHPSLVNHNAENFLLMEEMLFEAFQSLRKNPKFVWAQLPDAHRVPFLREWIARRFGKEYTPVERVKSYRRSCIIYRALDASNIKYPVPNANQIGKKLSLNYNSQNHMEKRVQHIKNKYYHLLDSHFLEQTRVFWFAMRGYICSNGPPRKSFFAYMPSRQQDIHHFRLWKSNECRHY